MSPNHIIHNWNGQLRLDLPLGTLAIVIAAVALVAFLTGLMVCPPKNSHHE